MHFGYNGSNGVGGSPCRSGRRSDDSENVFKALNFIRFLFTLHLFEIAMTRLHTKDSILFLSSLPYAFILQYKHSSSTPIECLNPSRSSFFLSLYFSRFFITISFEVSLECRAIRKVGYELGLRAYSVYICIQFEPQRVKVIFDYASCRIAEQRCVRQIHSPRLENTFVQGIFI